jgi:hypothetical protein
MIVEVCMRRGARLLNSERGIAGLLGCGVVLILAAAVPAGGADRLNLRASPSISYAPSQVRITAGVVPDADNRRLTIEAESESYFRSSDFGLEGENAPRTHFVEYRQLPAGEYRVTARLVGTRGQVAYVETTVTVYESGESTPF